MAAKGILVGVLLVACSLATWPAVAADCNNDTRRTVKGLESEGTAVRTYLDNRTGDFTVVGRVFRNGKQKDQALLAPGKSMVQVSNASGSGDVTAEMEVVFGLPDAASLEQSGRDPKTQARCTFSMKFLYDEQRSRISKVSCSDPSLLCKDCTITCKRSWNADKGQWHMHFNLKDPSSTGSDTETD